MNVKINGLYKHFKGSVYQVITLAKDSENLEDIVVYQNTDTDEVWVRPLSEFISKVDKEKYPDIKSEYRFEEIQ